MYFAQFSIIAQFLIRTHQQSENSIMIISSLAKTNVCMKNELILVLLHVN